MEMRFTEKAQYCLSLSKEKAKELLEKEQKQNPNEEKEELIENITEEMEEEYRGNRGRI